MFLNNVKKLVKDTYQTIISKINKPDTKPYEGIESDFYSYRNEDVDPKKWFDIHFKFYNNIFKVVEDEKISLKMINFLVKEVNNFKMSEYEIVSILKLLAINPKTPPEVLLELSFSSDYRIIEWLVTNPNLSPGILRSIYNTWLNDSNGYATITNLVRNPALDVDTMNTVYESGRYLCYLSENENLTQRIIRLLSKRDDINICFNLINNNRISNKILKQFLKHNDRRIVGEARKILIERGCYDGRVD